MTFIIVENEGGSKLGGTNKEFSSRADAQEELEQLVNQGLFRKEQISIKEL